MNKDELNEIFTDVRDSYRLIYKFQKRILDLVGYCGNYYKFAYSGGWSWYSNQSPRQGKGGLGNWSWDWLNMYLYDFHFEDKMIEKENIMLSIVIQSDTGYFDSKLIENNNLDKLGIDLFSKASKSETRLIFIASKKGWNMDKLFLKDSTKIKEYKLSQDYNEWKIINLDFHIVAKAYNLINFLNQKKTDEFLEDFTSFCDLNEIKIKSKNEV